MFKFVLFSSDGNYSGFKEYLIKPDPLPADEYVISEDTWNDKEALKLINGVPVFCLSKDRAFKIGLLKHLIKQAIEEQAVILGQDSSLEVLSYLHDYYNLSLQRQAKAFLKWRGYIWYSFSKMEKDFNSDVVGIKAFVAAQHSFDECLKDLMA